MPQQPQLQRHAAVGEDSFPFHRRPSVKQQNTAARPPNLRSDRLSAVLCFGAITIGIIVLIGYVLGNASIAALAANGKPVAAGTALVFIVLGAGLLALRSPAPAGVLTARGAALAVIVLAAADLLSAVLSRHIGEWQVWAARGGVIVHPYLITGLLLLASGSALVFITTRRDFAGHLTASAVLLICLFLLFGHILKVPSFLDPSTIVAPVSATAFGLVLITLAELLARPRGWVIPLLSRTSAGMMLRLLLPAAIVVPFVALALRGLIADARWFTPEVGLTVIVAVNVVFSAAIVLGAGVALHRRESDRARLAAIVDSSDDAIISASSQGLIESWNGGAERMYGYTAGETIGRPISMLARPELSDEIPLLLERVRRGERVDPFETTRISKDGRRIDVWLSVSPVRDNAGDVGTSAIVQDITNRKRAEEEIRRLAEQYSTLLATSSDGFWLVDLEGRLLDVNDAYCRMSGYSREELLELRISDVEAIETPEETASRIRSITESGVAHFETKHRTKDNRILDIEISVSLWRTAGRMLVFSRDITQRKQEQEALRRSEERLQLAQRAAGIGHFTWDLQTDINTRSDELLALYGLPPGSLGGTLKSFEERVFPDDLPTVKAEAREAMTSGEFVCDFRVVWPDASLHWLHARAKVEFSNDGKPLRMVGVNMDVTERKLAEEAMLRSEARYRTLVENLPQKIMLKDRNSVYVSVNEAYARDLGIEPKAVAGKTDHDFFPEDLAGKYRADDARIMEAGVTEELEEEYVEEGQRRFVHTVKTPVRDPQGNVTHILVIFWDITEKMLAGEQLRRAMADLEGLNRDLEKSEAALKGAQRVARVGHFERSLVTGAATWSEETYRILGIPKGSVTPSHELFLSMIVPEDRRRFEGEVARARNAAGERDIDIDLRITTPAGAAVVISVRIFVDRDAGGNAVTLHGTCQDITRRVEMEHALRDSEAALAEAQQIAHVGSAIVDVKTGEINASDEYFRIFDLEPRPGTPINVFLDRIHEEDRGAVKAALQAAVSSGTLDAEFRIVCGDGSIRFAHGIARRRPSNERIFGLLGTIEDVTERKLAEEALRHRSESLERSNLELERFNRVAVGRELRMIELKRQINDLCAQLGQPAPYVLPEERAGAMEAS